MAGHISRPMAAFRSYCKNMHRLL